MPGSTGVLTPPRPRLRLRIGVTGHRRLAAEAPVAAALERILDAVDGTIRRVAARAENAAAYAVPTDAKRTPSGLAYKVIKAGTGTRHPSARNQVTVHYSGWTTDGKMFDSSVTRGEAATFPLDGVIAGWTEGVQLMVEGETTRFWIPEALAYKGQSPPFGMLVFDVELIRIQ